MNTPTHSSAGEVEAIAGTAAYRDLIDRLKQRIRESHARAACTLNTELVMLYWSIGREIIDQQRAGGWGDDIVGRIAQDLAADVGPARGFSRRNLFYKTSGISSSRALSHSPIREQIVHIGRSLAEPKRGPYTEPSPVASSVLATDIPTAKATPVGWLAHSDRSTYPDAIRPRVRHTT
jgi:hypothetical protein